MRAGLCLAPGLVDMRVQLREPGAEHMESIESGGRAAAAGGVTTMVGAAQHRAAGRRRLGRRVPGPPGARGPARQNPHLCRRDQGARRQAADRDGAARRQRRARLHRRRQGDRRCAGHAPRARPMPAPSTCWSCSIRKSRASPRAGEVNEGEIATRLGLAGDHRRRPRSIMVERDLRLVEITGARYHAAHLSTAAGVEAIRRAQSARAAGDLRHRPALFRAERDRDRRLPHLRQIVAAVAQRGGPPRRRRRARATARSTRSPATTRHGTRIRSGCRSARRPTASSGSRPCCRCRWSFITTAISACST